MQGLRTQENDKFLSFFELVQSKAKELGKVFFLDSGEGNEQEIGTIECSDLSGWLIDFGMTNEFEKIYESFNDEDMDDRWDEFYVMVRWVKTSLGIDINFS